MAKVNLNDIKTLLPAIRTVLRHNRALVEVFKKLKQREPGQDIIADLMNLATLVKGHPLMINALREQKEVFQAGSQPVAAKPAHNPAPTRSAPLPGRRPGYSAPRYKL